ncbi:MAG TPA: diacylglycerol kinase family lipid kinase [Anaerolineae bacterium]|nr:diacylglycerol kinase family lipid kinase [Anaerolineae bacterium]
MRKARLIYNPAAGRFPAKTLVRRAKDVLKAAGWDVRMVISRSAKHLHTHTVKAVRDGCEAVFVAGGDGSVGAVGTALVGTDTALGVLPAGTSNVWAHDMGLETLAWSRWLALEHAAKRLARSQIRSVDVGVCNGRPFLLWTGIGLDGRMTGSLEPLGRLGKTFAIPQYFTRGVWNIRDWKSMPLRVRALGRNWEDRYLVVIASNICSYAGGLFSLSPDAKVDDGLMDYWLVGGDSLRDAIVRVVQVLRGSHLEEPKVVHFQADKVIVEGDDVLPMQCDGEPGTIEPPLEFSVKPRALKVLVPDDDVPRLFSQS